MKFDEFFLKGVNGTKKIHRIRSNSYYRACGYIIYLIYELISHNSPWQLNLLITALVTLRLILLKKQMLKTYDIIETFVYAVYPLSWSKPAENLLRGSIFPVLYPVILYFFMMPLQHGLLIILTNVYLVSQFKVAALDIFNSTNETLKISMIKNLYDGIYFFMATGYLVLVLSRLQIDAIFKDQKKLVKELKVTNAKLTEVNKQREQSVKLLEAANKELEFSKKKLEEALKAKDLLATVSHELRNPLNSLLGNIELLLDEVTNKEQLQKLEVAKFCGDALLCLINNLLDAAKIASDKLEVSLIPVNMYQFLEKVWRINSVIIKKQNLTGEFYISRNFPRYLMLDSHRIMQIMMNLVSNSVKFTEKGAVKIMISWTKQGDISQTRCLLNFTQPRLENLMNPEKRSMNTVSSENRKSFQLQINPGPQNSEISLHSGNESKYDSLSNISSVSNMSNFHDDTITLTAVTQSSPKFIKDLVTEKYHVFTCECQNISEILEKQKNIPKPLQGSGGSLKIEIVDTGCGIARDAQTKLFTPFTQEDASITRKYGGTGLGLYIIKNLVSKMNGDIALFSEKNAGTHFIIQIPSDIINDRKQQINLSTAIKLNPSKSYSGCAVMIVEDNSYNQTILKTFMDKFGFRSYICNNGKEGYELYKSKPPGYFSFITMDLQMPAMDGITSSTSIREHEKKERILNPVPIVIVTGNCSDREKSICMNSSGHVRASFFFRKPLTFADCSHFVSVIMNKKDESLLDIKMRKNPHFLVVDDDHLSLNLLCQYLKNKNIEYDIATNGLEAFEKFKANCNRFDGVLMDCEMPVMNGIEATENIKRFLKQTKARDIPVYGLTGHTDSEHEARFKEVGMSKIFHKPVNFVELVAFLLRTHK